MKSLIKLEMNKLLSTKLLLLLIGLVIFGLDERIIGQLSAQQFILNIITEHYYLTYFMIPIFMLIIYDSLEDDMEYILIRSKSYWNYFKSKLAVYSMFSFVFVVVQITMAYALSIGLKSDSSFIVPINSSYELFGYFSQYFDSTIQAIIISSLYMMFGLFIIAISFLSINHFFDKKTSSKIIILSYILMNLGLKVPNLNNLPIFFIDNYIIFHRNFAYDFKLLVNLFTMLIIFIVVCILNKKYWNKKFRFNFNIENTSIFNYYKKKLFCKNNLLIIAGVITLMSFWSLLKNTSTSISLNDYMINVFWGHPVNDVRLIQFLEMLVLNTAPLYILSIFLERESNDRTLFVNIRLKKGTYWIDSVLKISLMFILSFLVLNILIPLIIGLCMGMIIDVNFINLIATIFISKLSDLVFQFLVLILIYSLSKNISLSFLSILALNSICFLPFKWSLYSPFGISSLSRLDYIVGSFGLSLPNVIVELLVLIVFAFILIKKYSHKKILID